MVKAVAKKEVLEELERLPDYAVGEVADFIRFLRFKTTDPSQAYFWTEKWQKGENLVDTALREGRYRDFDYPNQALEWLNK
ncbi:MAG: hypothetical protein AB1297_09465 [bacterium]